MKITETIERECCDERLGDLRPYRGSAVRKVDKSVVPEMDSRGIFKFCVHCGQIYRKTRQTDAAGGSEDVLVKVDIVI